MGRQREVEEAAGVQHDEPAEKQDRCHRRTGQHCDSSGTPHADDDLARPEGAVVARRERPLGERDR